MTQEYKFSWREYADWIERERCVYAEWDGPRLRWRAWSHNLPGQLQVEAADSWTLRDKLMERVPQLLSEAKIAVANGIPLPGLVVFALVLRKGTRRKRVLLWGAYSNTVTWSI